MQGVTYTSRPISVDALSLRDMTRADVQFHGVRHSGASFEARVFVNKPDADEETDLSVDNGYAGAFRVFGHGGCFGDAGHCEVHGEPGRYDPRVAHPLAPIEKLVTATEVLREAASEGGEVTVTVVPVITGLTEQCNVENVFRFDRLSIVTYRSEEERAVSQGQLATQA